MSIMEVMVYFAIILITFVFMEWVAWFLHRYVMHGFGWYLHEDHHRYHKGRLEKNDVFGLAFSIISFLLIFFGTIYTQYYLIAFGIGVTMYGIAYFLVHDVFFHKRVKLRYKPKSDYMKRVLKAHAIHHQKSTPHSGVAFGFLYASKKYKQYI